MLRQTKSGFKNASFLLVLLAILVGGALAGYLWIRQRDTNTGRYGRVMSWLRNPGEHPDWAVQAGQRCGSAPFIIPSDGFVGFIWDDSFRIGHRHQGIDIFGGGDVNQTPVVAAYAGYLTRLPEWKSTLIIRIPQDPLQPGRQIWTYYTHLADSQGITTILDHFPPGTYERYVEAGELLGYQGNYSGTPGSPVGVHLHFSIVLDNGEGHFRNELEIGNTLDPSPYLGMPLNANTSDAEVPLCPD